MGKARDKLKEATKEWEDEEVLGLMKLMVALLTMIALILAIMVWYVIRG